MVKSSNRFIMCIRLWINCPLVFYLCHRPVCLLFNWNTNLLALTLCSSMLKKTDLRCPAGAASATSLLPFPRAPLTSPLTRHNDWATHSSQTWACIVMCSWETFSAVWKDNRSFVELLYPHLVHWPHLLLLVVLKWLHPLTVLGIEPILDGVLEGEHLVKKCLFFSIIDLLNPLPPAPRVVATARFHPEQLVTPSQGHRERQTNTRPPFTFLHICKNSAQFASHAGSSWMNISYIEIINNYWNGLCYYQNANQTETLGSIQLWAQERQGNFI